MVDSAIKDFFETETYLAFTTVTEKVVNARYNPQGYGNDREQFLDAIYPALSVKMSPFKQLVFEEVRKIVATQLNVILTTKRNETLMQFGEFLNGPAKDASGRVFDNKFNEIVMQMAGTMFSGIISAASQQAEQNTKMMLQNNGIQLRN
jgi:hypothetical protein